MRWEKKKPDGAGDFHPMWGVLGNATSSRDVSFLKDSKEELKLTSPLWKGDQPTDSTR